MSDLDIAVLYGISSLIIGVASFIAYSRRNADFDLVMTLTVAWTLMWPFLILGWALKEVHSLIYYWGKK